MQSEPKKLQQFLQIKLSEQQKEMEVTNLQVDSRKVKPGDMFIAYPGAAVDGRQFIAQAVDAGAACVLAETAKTAEEQQWLADVGCELLEIDNLQQQLGEIAAHFYGNPSQLLDVVAVTGTNGKTSVTQLIAQALEFSGKKSAVLGTLGNGPLDALEKSNNTTPGAIDVQGLLRKFVDNGVQAVAMEASSHGLEQGRIVGTKINTAVVTNISRDHLDYHGTMEAYRQAKEILVHWPDLESLVVNADDPNVMHMATKVAEKLKVLTFSMVDPSADLYAGDIQYSASGIQFKLCFQDQSVVVRSSLLGSFNVANLLAVCGVLLLRGFTLKAIAETAAKLKPIPGRMEMVSIKCQESSLPTVIVDYAHTPDALSQALQAVRKHCEGALWCVFGCGGDRDKGKRALMGQVASELADHIVLTNDNPRSEQAEEIFEDIEAGFDESVDYYVQKDRKMAIYDVVKEAKASDCILIAGKGHEDYQEVDGMRYPFSDLKTARKALKKRRQDSESP